MLLRGECRPECLRWSLAEAALTDIFRGISAVASAVSDRYPLVALPHVEDSEESAWLRKGVDFVGIPCGGTFTVNGYLFWLYTLFRSFYCRGGVAAILDILHSPGRRARLSHARRCSLGSPCVSSVRSLGCRVGDDRHRRRCKHGSSRFNGTHFCAARHRRVSDVSGEGPAKPAVG